jgi:hypothetical protein
MKKTLSLMRELITHAAKNRGDHSDHYMYSSEEIRRCIERERADD